MHFFAGLAATVCTRHRKIAFYAESAENQWVGGKRRLFLWFLNLFHQNFVFFRQKLASSWISSTKSPSFGSCREALLRFPWLRGSSLICIHFIDAFKRKADLRLLQKNGNGQKSRLAWSIRMERMSGLFWRDIMSEFYIRMRFICSESTSMER